MTPMTPRRFGWLLHARGADLSRWPAPERAAALLLLRGDAASRAALADALAGDDAPDADCDALDRMQSRVRRALAPPPPVLRGVRWGVLAACVAAGLYLGLSPSGETAVAPAATSMEATTPATVLAALDP